VRPTAALTTDSGHGEAGPSRAGGSGGASAPPTPRRPHVPPRRHRRDEQPAGRVLLIMVLGLALAGLVNADALVDRAERKPLGSGRDRSLAIWHPVQDLAHVTQISRLRDLGDWAVGNEDQGGGGIPLDGTPTDVPADAVRPTLRPPTAGEPLRVYIGGDSIVRDTGDAFLNLASDSPLFETELHYENATGLTRPDFYDWPAALRNDMETHRPEVAFILFGGNDSQGILGPNGEAYDGPGDPRWREEYARRVAGVMDLLRADDRVVYWIGLPPMRDDGFDGRADVMNEIYRAAAEDRPWMTYLDLDPIFGDEAGRYVERKQDGSGELVDLRQDDGVHLSQPGASQLARVMLDLIDEEIQAGRSEATTETEPE
jgi:lysophospholipase L1-like esterase